MAGWSIIVEEKCGTDCSRALRKKRVCTLDAAPPKLGDGKPVDLIKFPIAREKVGCDAVCENGLWGMVAEEFWLALDLSLSVKLVYVKYLDTIKKGLEGIVEESITDMSDKASVVRKVSIGKWTARNRNIAVALNGSEKCPVDDEDSVHIGTANIAAGNIEVEKVSCNLCKSATVDSFSDKLKNPLSFEVNLHSNLTNLQMSNKDKNVVVDMDEGKECDGEDGSNDINMNSSETSIRKRKRESLSRMLDWITGVARGPCDNVVDPLPGCSKWESYGSQEVWKQVILIREQMFLKSNSDSSAEKSTAKKNWKMHPSMYCSQLGSAYKFRERLKVNKNLLPHVKSPSKARARSQSSSSSNTKTDSDSTELSLIDLPTDKVIPLGPDFQADVPEWLGAVSQSDSKWLGNRNWPPLEKVDNRYIVEREPIGKGRQKSCGCEVPESIECVRFHIAERRSRMKRELGIAFSYWGLDKMGEEVKLGWGAEEEKRFKTLAYSNPPSLDKSYWDEIVKYFPNKKMEELVSYHFNVFLLQRRARQNRLTPNNIDSDDDDVSVVTPSSRREAPSPKSSASLLHSAKQSGKNVK